MVMQWNVFPCLHYHLEIYVCVVIEINNARQMLEKDDALSA